MIKKSFFALLIVAMLIGCGKKDKQKTDFQVSHPSQSDRQPNGGMLRFTIDDKSMHDKYFVAQFTPRGDMFEYDNLQLFNYNIGSDKYPQFIININYKESDLKKWEGKSFPLDFLAFTPSPKAIPLNSRGEIMITRVIDNEVEGKFSGELIHPKTGQTHPIKGEFRAVLKVNV